MKRWPLPLVASFVLFIVLCISLAYWALQLFKPPLRPVTAPPVAAQVAPDLDAAASLFGGRSTTAVASNFQLQGVVMSGSAGQSVAILTTEGKPAKAVRVGSEIEPGVTVKEVHRGYVLLADGGAIKRVELPAQVDAMGAQSGSVSPVAGRGEAASARTSGSAPAPAAPSTTPVPPMRTAPASPPTVVVSPPPSQASTPAPAAATPGPISPPAAPSASTVEPPVTNAAPVDRSQPAAAAVARPAAPPVPATTVPAPAVQAAQPAGTRAQAYPPPAQPAPTPDPSSQPLRQTRPLQQLPSEQ